MGKFIRRLFQIGAVSLLAAAISLCFVTVPAGHFGVAIEKTEGFQGKIFDAGTHFLWSGFVPGKWKILNIPSETVSYVIPYSQNLRLTEYLQLGDQFRIRLQLLIDAKFKKDQVALLLKTTDGSPQNFQAFLEKSVHHLIESRFLDVYENDTLSDLPVRFRNYFAYEGQFKEDLQSIFTNPESDFFSIEKWEIRSLYVPDNELYRRHVLNLDQVANARREALIQSIFSRSATEDMRIENTAKIDYVKMLGDLLKMNPAAEEALKWTSVQTLHVHEAPGNVSFPIQSGPAVPAANDPKTGVIAPLKK